jgi:hypothetical protein
MQLTVIYYLFYFYKIKRVFVKIPTTHLKLHQAHDEKSFCKDIYQIIAHSTIHADTNVYIEKNAQCYKLVIKIMSIYYLIYNF